MSESIQESNGDSESESSASLNQSYSTQSSTSGTESSSRACDDINCRSCGTTATKESQASRAGSGDLNNSSNRYLAHSNEPSSSRVVANETEESTSILKNRSDEVTQGSLQKTGLKCDIKPEAPQIGCSSSPRSDSSLKDSDDLAGHDLDSTLILPSTSRSTNDSFSVIDQGLRRATLRPTPSVSSSTIDTNNNRNSSGRSELLSGLKRNNFSKSASGSRLVSRNETRSKVCDCLSQNCNEKEHSNRRQFIESYYNNRTRLPSANATSTSNISTPLNRLSECDEITKRLLSSPIRTLNISDRSNKRAQTGEVDTSRRASLGTNSITDKVSSIASSQFNPLGLIYSKSAKGVSDNQDDQQQQQQESHRASLTFAGYSLSPKDVGAKLKQQQQQGRSLSVCQDDSSNLRFRNITPNHSVNLCRAVSLACESSSPRQLLTIIPLFGCDMKALEQFIKLGWVLPPPIESAIDYILAHGIDSIGIFRKSGVKSRILTLKKRIEASQSANLEDLNRDNEFSIYDIADLVKMWFRELKPMPLMTKDLIRLISNYLQAQKQADACSSQQRSGGTLERELDLIEKEEGSSLKQKIGSMVSPTHKALITKAITFLATISSKSEVNQMTSQNLAICLTPSLCATESDQTSILVAQRALRYCIDNYRILF